MPSFRRKSATLVYRDLTRGVIARTPLPSTWIVEDVPSCSDAPPPPALKKSKAADVEAWKGSRELLHMPAVELECLPSNAICSVCRVLEEAELWRCGDCGSDKYFCATCAMRTHSTPNIIHQLELWKACKCCVPAGGPESNAGAKHHNVSSL